MILRKRPLLFSVTQQPVVAVLTPLQNARRFEWRCLVQHLAQEFFEAELEILDKRGEIRKRFVGILDVWQKSLVTIFIDKKQSWHQGHAIHIWSNHQGVEEGLQDIVRMFFARRKKSIH